MGYGEGHRGGYGLNGGFKGGTNGTQSKGAKMPGDTMTLWGKGERRSPAKFVPARGGGEWGKKMRQAQQAAIKDEKTKREVDYFWQQQEYFSGGGKGRKGKGSQDSERSLFGAQRENVGIDFDKYDDIPVDLSGDGADRIAGLETFDELWDPDRYHIHDFLWENLERCHYKRPTPIQRFAIPVALAGYDAMCCAQTGSGKTCAFLLPIISSLDTAQAFSVIGCGYGEMSAPRAVVLAPTRELCSQIHLEAKKLSFQSPIRAGEVYGGVDAKPQLLDLARGSCCWKAATPTATAAGGYCCWNAAFNRPADGFTLESLGEALKDLKLPQKSLSAKQGGNASQCTLLVADQGQNAVINAKPDFWDPQGCSFSILAEKICKDKLYLTTRSGKGRVKRVGDVLCYDKVEDEDRKDVLVESFLERAPFPLLLEDGAPFQVAYWIGTTGNNFGLHTDMFTEQFLCQHQEPDDPSRGPQWESMACFFDVSTSGLFHHPVASRA
eukprot:s783_g7.t1